MRRWLAVFILAIAMSSVARASDRIYKVLPQFLDDKGLNSTSPSLFDRDAYQAFLRRHPVSCSGLQYAIEWNARGPKSRELKLRVELRGVTEGDVPKSRTIEAMVHPHGWFSHWAYVKLEGEEYKKFGPVTAWRATMWDGDKLLSEQK